MLPTPGSKGWLLSKIIAKQIVDGGGVVVTRRDGEGVVNVDSNGESPVDGDVTVGRR